MQPQDGVFVSSLSTDDWESDPDVGGLMHIANGATRDMHAGDIAALPAGTETTWHITAPFREFWVLSGPDESGR